MKRNAIEPILGALVLAAAAAFLFFAYQKAGQRGFEGYTLTARFSAVDGLQPGTDVRISCVKVGQVLAINIDPKTYLAMVKLVIDPNIKLPDDTIAAVSTEGLLGGKYLRLLPGASDDMLKAGSRIDATQASISLDDLLGKLMYSVQDLGKSSVGDQHPASAAPGAPGAAPAHP